MSHLSRDRVVDAVEGRLDGQVGEHLSTCARCRAEVDELEATLREVRGVEVPEPSPLFWDYLSARVREGIAAEPLLRPESGRWGSWTWRPAAALLALLLAASAGALLMRMPWRSASLPAAGPASAVHSADTPDESFELASGDDWQFVVDAANAADWDVADWDAAQASGIEARPGATELAVTELSADERRELVKLLNEALAEPDALHPPKGDV